MSTPPTPRSDEIEGLLALDVDDLYALAARQDPMNEGVAFSLRYSTTALRIALMTDALVRVGWGNLGRIFSGVAAADRMATSDLLDFYGVEEPGLA